MPAFASALRDDQQRVDHTRKQKCGAGSQGLLLLAQCGRKLGVGMFASALRRIRWSGSEALWSVYCEPGI